MRNKLVMKFGGTALMTVDRIKKAAKIVAANAASGKQIIVVVSAMGYTTDELIKLSDEITAMPDSRELDALMATGEQVSATLMALALQALGLKARSFSGSQAGISTDAHFGDAKIVTLNANLLADQLNEGIIPVVTGFQGITADSHVTTLGRGGSDITAIALAAAIRAERCDVYTDVDGVYSADPRIVPNAIRHNAISVSEMLELAKSGAQVLNARSVEVARDKQVVIRVRSTFNSDDEGTLITTESNSINSFTGVAQNNNVNCIDIHLQKLEPGMGRRLSAFRLVRSQSKRNLLKLLSNAGITAEITDSFKANPFHILLLVKKADSVAALSVLRKAELSIREFTVRTDLSAISLVATKITTKHFIESTAAVLQSNIEILARAWHEQRLTLVVPMSMCQQAVNALHCHFAAVDVAA